MSLSAHYQAAAKSRQTFNLAPPFARGLVLAAVALGAIGALATGGDTQTASTDADLVGLLRFMALLKAALALVLIGAVWWRLALPIDGMRLAAYAATGAAMTAGPVVIWTMSHLGLGAALLHAGLLASCLLLWHDPAVAGRLSALVARRRH